MESDDRLVRLRERHASAAMYAVDVLTGRRSLQGSPEDLKAARELAAIAAAYSDGVLATSRGWLREAVVSSAANDVMKEAGVLKPVAEISSGDVSRLRRHPSWTPGFDRELQAAIQTARTKSGAPARVMNFPISELEVSERVLRTLERLGAETIGDVTRMRPSQLLSQPGFGRQSLVRLSLAMAEFGLSLAPERRRKHRAVPSPR